MPPPPPPSTKDGGIAEGKGPFADKALPNVCIDFEQRQHLVPAGFAAVSASDPDHMRRPLLCAICPGLHALVF